VITWIELIKVLNWFRYSEFKSKDKAGGSKFKKNSLNKLVDKALRRELDLKQDS